MSWLKELTTSAAGRRLQKTGTVEACTFCWDLREGTGPHDNLREGTGPHNSSRRTTWLESYFTEVVDSLSFLSLCCSFCSSCFVDAVVAVLSTLWMQIAPFSLLLFSLAHGEPAPLAGKDLHCFLVSLAHVFGTLHLQE